MLGNDVHLVVIKRWQAILIVAVLLLAIFSGSYNTIQGWQVDKDLAKIQERMQVDQEMLEKRRFKAEMRACTLTQNGVRGERRLIRRAMNVSRENGTLTKEALNFYRVSLNDLKVPSCTPTDLGFPQFDPENLLP